MQTKNLKLKTQNCGGGFLIVVAVTLCVLSGVAWSIENPSVGNPIGSSTLPPSSAGSGLIRSPNPLSGNSGNLIITGNVGGGRSFHGSVPYGSTTGFRAPLGSTSLDSFLRDSTSSDNFDRYLERYRVQPYYSPTETVTTMTPGRSSVFVPSTTRIAERAPDVLGPEDMSKKKISPEPQQDTSVSSMRLLPTPLSPQQIEKLSSEEIAGHPRSERLTSEQYTEQMQQLQRELQRIKEKTDNLNQKLGEKDESLQVSAKIEPGERVRQQLEEPGTAETKMPAPQKQTEEPPALMPTEPIQKQERPDNVSDAEKERLRKADIYEQVKQQIDKLQASQGKEKTPEVTGKSSELTYGESAAAKEQLSKEESYLEALRKGQPSPDDTYSKTSGVTGVEEISGKKNSVLDEVGQLSAAKLSAEAKRIMGPHKDLESLSEAKFNQYILAAQTYLKQGKFYRAADTYGLASVYKKDDPAAYAGRGQALFAAGEYVSSALFISRAIETSAAYAQTKVDFVTIFGDKDRLESRIADVEEWLRKSGSAELQFLLGYIYYQTGKLDSAKKAIDAAYEKNPQRPAVQAVKKAIDDAIGSQGTK
jgi:tetratricopeptide (TPR) repeat protein